MTEQTTTILIFVTMALSGITVALQISLLVRRRRDRMVRESEAGTRPGQMRGSISQYIRANGSVPAAPDGGFSKVDAERGNGAEAERQESRARDAASSAEWFERTQRELLAMIEGAKPDPQVIAEIDEQIFSRLDQYVRSIAEESARKAISATENLIVEPGETGFLKMTMTDRTRF